MNPTCPGCGCNAANAAHEVVAALAAGDLDRAMSLGLLSVEPCIDCTLECREALATARAARERALAARERFRQRELRLQCIADERKTARAAGSVASHGHGRERPPLPGTAAAALARAKAKAANKTADGKR